MVVDPRFTRSAAVADHYAPIRRGHRHRLPVGGDQLPADQRQDPPRLRAQLHQRRLHREATDFGFNEGLFTGYDEEKRTYDRIDLGIRDRAGRLRRAGHDAAGSALRLPADEEALRALHARGGGARSPARRRTSSCTVAEWVASTGQRRARMTIMYALGWTQHSSGSQNIRSAAMIQLLLRQHRRPRRRRQRAARALQRAGHHRHRHADGVAAGLSGDADRRRADARVAPRASGPSRRCRRTRPATGRTTASSTSAS